MRNTRVDLVIKRYTNPKIYAAHFKTQLGSDTSNSVTESVSCLFKLYKVSLALRPLLKKEVIFGSCNSHIKIRPTRLPTQNHTTEL